MKLRNWHSIQIFSQLEKKIKWWVYHVLVIWKSKAKVKKYVTPNLIVKKMENKTLAVVLALRKESFKKGGK